MSIYDELYSGNHNYGYPNDRIVEVQKIIGNLLNWSSMLDVSAGRGELARQCVPRGRVCATEACDYLLQHDLVGLPRFKWELPDPYPGQTPFDLVVCSDVLEHLEPDQIIPALIELDVAARCYLVLSIGLGPCVWPRFTEDLHKTQWTIEQWKQVINDTLRDMQKITYREDTANLYVLAVKSA